MADVHPGKWYEQNGTRAGQATGNQRLLSPHLTETQYIPVLELTGRNMQDSGRTRGGGPSVQTDDALRKNKVKVVGQSNYRGVMGQDGCAKQKK